jgi:DNA repair exonuclease SbcCD ATPase subunit
MMGEMIQSLEERMSARINRHTAHWKNLQDRMETAEATLQRLIHVVTQRADGEPTYGSLIESLQKQIYELREDIQQVSDEIQVVWNMTGIKDKLERGARAVMADEAMNEDLQRALRDMEEDPRKPMKLAEAGEEIRVHPHAFRILCSNCGTVLLHNDGHRVWETLAEHECPQVEEVDKFDKWL